MHQLTFGLRLYHASFIFELSIIFSCLISFAFLSDWFILNFSVRFISATLNVAEIFSHKEICPPSTSIFPIPFPYVQLAADQYRYHSNCAQGVSLSWSADVDVRVLYACKQRDKAKVPLSMYIHIASLFVEAYRLIDLWLIVILLSVGQILPLYKFFVELKFRCPYNL